jgi:hypothetical protein
MSRNSCNVHSLFSQVLRTTTVAAESRLHCCLRELANFLDQDGQVRERIVILLAPLNFLAFPLANHIPQGVAGYVVTHPRLHFHLSAMLVPWRSR